MYVKSTLDMVETLDTPTDVAVSAANRRLTVAWREMPDATSYRIAVRPKNELVPAWREHAATSSPDTIESMWAMSGMEYEVRVAAVSGRGHSEWSAPVSMTAPVLQAAPADAIGGFSSPVVGQLIAVGVNSQRPFANRSQWHWFISGADGSDRKVLPRHQARPTWEFFMDPSMEGKHLSVQVDYDKEGVSYSATAELGIVEAAGVLTTHLYDLQTASVYLRDRWDHIPNTYVRGGAIAPLGNDLLVVTPWGRFNLIRPTTGEVVPVEGNVPMNKAGLLAHPDKDNILLNRFQVTDILLKRRSAGRYELFVAHHHFTSACLRFRLSATTLRHRGTDVSVSPKWRTIYDAEPCLKTASVQAGGRMLTDGPDHLLVVPGPHLVNEDAQDPASHLGKLVRVEIETGRAEVLASGLRNSQGLARDAAGRLWGTDHGPQGGDELNVLVAGGNYGWPRVSYGVGYGSRVNVPRAEAVGLHDGFAKPVFAWVPSIGISSVIVNDERLFPLWRDDLLIGSLSGTQGSGHALFRVRRDGTDVQYVERIELGYRIRDLTQMPDRRLALLLDGGLVRFLSRSYDHCADEAKWD